MSGVGNLQKPQCEREKGSKLDHIEVNVLVTQQKLPNSTNKTA